MPAGTQSFVEFARSRCERIEAALAARVPQGEGCPERLSEAIRYSLLDGGKRLRPLLVLLATEACGGSEEQAMPAACAVEMIHVYSLIHDDLPAMDDDDLRRGKPTCHKVYGDALAILAGDALLTRAFGLLAEEIEPPQASARCAELLSQAAGAAGMVGGQVDDIDGESSEGGLERLEYIHRRKTGAMMTVSLLLGATVAGADDAMFSSLATYGRCLGLAFQIVDDLLDVQGDESVVGKRVGKDRDQGKLTFPGLMGIETSRRRASELVAEACQALEPFGERSQRLEALARYVLERNR